MCGLFFSINKRHFIREPEKVLNVLKSRGPDDNGYEKFKVNDLFIDMGHTRLSIRGIDEITCSQPLISKCNRFVLVYNGEIYNSDELSIKFLESNEYPGDTPLLFDLLKKHGINVMNKIEGMFAFIFVDKLKQKAFAVRDQIGIKPLYYSFEDGSFVMGSTIKSLQAAEIVPNISTEDLFESLSTGYASGEDCGFTNIKKLKPGYFIEIDLNNKLTKKFHIYENEALQPEFRDAFPKIVNQQIASDVGMCIFFSGGLDSSLIASLCDKKLIHLSYANSDDQIFAEKIAGSLNRTQGVREFTRGLDIFKEAQFIAENVEEPISDYTFLATYELSKFARQKGFKVALSGMGADEIFYGYPRYKAFALIKLLKAIQIFLSKKTVKYILSLLIKDPKKYLRLLNAVQERNIASQYISLLGYLSKSEIEVIWRSDYQSFYRSLLQKIESQSGGVNSRYEYAANVDFHGFLQHNLTVTDKASMLASIETRVPFLSEKIYFMIQKVKSKKLLLELVSKKIPKVFFKRKKQGFNPPLVEIISKVKKDTLIAQLDDSPIFKFLSRAHVIALIKDHYSGGADRTYQVWQIIFLSQWLKVWGK